MATATKAKTLKIQPLEDRVVISPPRRRSRCGWALHPRHRQGEADPGGGHRGRPGRFEKGAGSRWSSRSATR